MALKLKMPLLQSYYCFVSEDNEYNIEKRNRGKTHLTNKNIQSNYLIQTCFNEDEADIKWALEFVVFLCYESLQTHKHKIHTILRNNNV